MTKLSCGIVPVRKKGNSYEFLILRCFKNWDFPKGMKEPTEDPITAARREFSEETGVENINILAEESFIDTEPYNHGKVARYYLGVVEKNAEIIIRPNPVTGILEHQEFRWVSFDEAHDLFVPRLKLVLSWAKDRLMTGASS